MLSEWQKIWAETWRHTASSSLYYREIFRGQTSAPDLSTAPFLDKSILSARNLDFLCVPRERVVEVVTTSGTTGEPLLWLLTENDLRRLAKNEELAFTGAGLSVSDTVVIAVALDRGFIAGLAYWLGLREVGCRIVRVGPSSPLLVIDLLRRLRPTAIVGVPSFLRLIATKAEAIGFDLAGAGVKRAICIGEPIRERNFALNAAGEAIERSWGAKVHSTYGVTELAASMCECESGRGGHVPEHWLHVEIVDEEGRAMPDGEVGEVVATTFGVEAMPVIRYRTGDYAAIFRGPCACGRSSPRIGAIVGRKHQRLKFRGASLFPSTLQTVLESTDGVESFVIVARAQDALSDAIEVLVQGNAAPAAVSEALQARARIAPAVRQASREEIESLQMPPQARKRRTFVDLR